MSVLIQSDLSIKIQIQNWIQINFLGRFKSSFDVQSPMKALRFVQSRTK